MSTQPHSAAQTASVHSLDPQAGPHDALMLNPAARVLWRARDQVQLELGRRRVILDGADPELVRHLTGQPGGRRPTSGTLDALASGGFLLRPAPADPAAQVPRLSADLAALRARHGADADAILVRRRGASVLVLGATRIAGVVAPLLAGGGVGHVAAAGDGDVRLHHAAPGGVLPDDEGRRFSASVAAAVRRAAPECDAGPSPSGVCPDLIVVALDEPVPTELRESLHVRGAPHLTVQTGADYGVVGPLTLPGVVSCLRCADLHRLDRDEAWTALAVQLAVPRRHGPPSDVSLTSLVGSLAALQALAFLDGEDAATIEGTLEFTLPDWRVRRRSWPAHPDCDCGALTAQTLRSAQ